MSFWARLGLSIGNLDVMKRVCAQNGVEYVANEDKNFMMQGAPVVASLNLKNKSGRGAFIVRMQGTCKLIWDNDQNYSPISKQFGKNGGTLTRGYTTEVLKHETQRAGGFVLSENIEADGSVVLKVGVGGGM